MNEATATQPSPATSKARRSVPLVTALFAVLLLAAVAGSLWAVTREQTRLAEAPAVLAGISLVNVTTGAEALSSMERLHGKGIGLEDGWIATYGQGGVLWVGEAESAAAASRLMIRMNERIEDGNEMFTHLGTESFGDVITHKVTDGSMLHYYYGVGDKVVWITAPAESGEQFVEEAIATLS